MHTQHTACGPNVTYGSFQSVPQRKNFLYLSSFLHKALFPCLEKLHMALVRAKKIGPAIGLWEL
jgi:hypothetical protein